MQKKHAITVILGKTDGGDRIIDWASGTVPGESVECSDLAYKRIPVYGV